ncbi:MAG: hypothetical protein JST70_16890 [Bacteroidetes bacterium]|nr:hypothetical protein [Bacteroidota bacterium]
MRKLTVDVISALFVLLWVYAALSKITDFDKFKVQLGQSPLLTAFATWVAWIIPTVEILLAVLLAIPRTRLPALYASFSLMVMFTAYIVAITQFSEYIPCSCGGILQHMSWNAHLVFNLLFVGLALTAIILFLNPGIKHNTATIKT